MPAALDPNSVHAMSGEVTLGEGEARERIGMFWVPERNRTTGEQQGCALLNWDVSNEPRTLLGMEEAEEVQAYFNKAFPSLQDGITLEAAEQFLRQTPSVNYVNKCSRYHDSRSRILLLGDAAHCTGGASGQGCNSALQDAASLWRTLEECEHDLERAMEKFSEERVPEGHALLDLSIHQSPRYSQAPLSIPPLPLFLPLPLPPLSLSIPPLPLFLPLPLPPASPPPASPPPASPPCLSSSCLSSSCLSLAACTSSSLFNTSRSGSQGSRRDPLLRVAFLLLNG
eukprot:32785-Hanusia_phi.AAC.2